MGVLQSTYFQSCYFLRNYLLYLKLFLRLVFNQNDDTLFKKSMALVLFHQFQSSHIAQTTSFGITNSATLSVLFSIRVTESSLHPNSSLHYPLLQPILHPALFSHRPLHVTFLNYVKNHFSNYIQVSSFMFIRAFNVKQRWLSSILLGLSTY